MSETLREHLEAIRDRNDRPTPPHKWNEEDYRDAVAALQILDDADKEWVKGSVIPPGRLPGWWRLVPDPEPRS